MPPLRALVEDLAAFPRKRAQPAQYKPVRIPHKEGSNRKYALSRAPLPTRNDNAPLSHTVRLDSETFRQSNTERGTGGLPPRLMKTPASHPRLGSREPGSDAVTAPAVLQFTSGPKLQPAGSFRVVAAPVMNVLGTGAPVIS